MSVRRQVDAHKKKEKNVDEESEEEKNFIKRNRRAIESRKESKDYFNRQSNKRLAKMEYWRGEASSKRAEIERTSL